MEKILSKGKILAIVFMDMSRKKISETHSRGETYSYSNSYDKCQET